MTDTVTTIDKNRTLLSGQDYNLLRTQGIQHIQTLSGNIWTDHNDHDPGITNLEILCYALTDLGYRTAFAMPDLLTPDPESGVTDPPKFSGLFPAHEVLPNTPLTVLDYRRLLLKIEGVRNAWFDAHQYGPEPDAEVKFYVDCLAGGLSAKQQNVTDPVVHVRGLHRVLLELEIDEKLGSLNETRLTYTVKRGALKGVTLSLDSDPAGIDFAPNFAGIDQVDQVSQQPDSSFTANISVTLEGGGNVPLNSVTISVPAQESVDVDATAVEALLNADTPHKDGIIRYFWEKQQKRQAIIDRICCTLEAHRNLSEDFLSIETVQAERVAVCADVDVQPDADLEKVMAEIYHALAEYFNPTIPYYTLAEMLAEGLCADEIFNRPYIDTQFQCGGEPVFTKPGFIKDKDLENSELRRFIYTSDLINIIMDIPGVVAIKNVLLRKVDIAGKMVGKSEKWCLEISPLHQPLLAQENSKLLLFKNQIPYRVRPTEFAKTLAHLRALARKEAYVEPNQVLPVPQGSYRKLRDYFSIQHDYPQTYGIGEAGLPEAAGEERLAQARQFKGYLTFFDQLLADYLAQLANVRRLFSLDKTLSQTYFGQYLKQIPGVSGDFATEMYKQPAALQVDVEAGRLYEDETLFQNRRNRVLDHLLARFAEQFTDYVLMMFNLDGDRIQTNAQLIDDKIDFLTEYPALSRERNKAFNARPENPADIWDTANVSGLEKRIARLVGIDNYDRRDLACYTLFNILFSTRLINNQHRLEIKTATNTIIFKSVQLFPDKESALAEAQKLIPFIRQEGSYTVDDAGGAGTVRFHINAGGVTLEQDQDYDSEADAVQDIRGIIERYDEILQTVDGCDQEGFHLIEHILLRPMNANDPLYQVCLDHTCTGCGDEDPYTFRLHLVMPYWPRRFQNLNFRRHFEQMVRTETPAHIHVRICWISNEHMMLLDERYRSWLEIRAQKEADPAVLRAALGDLLDILHQLKTVYPPATLHDCLEDEDETPIRLGSTNLGIF